MSCKKKNETTQKYKCTQFSNLQAQKEHETVRHTKSIKQTSLINRFVLFPVDCIIFLKKSLTEYKKMPGIENNIWKHLF